MSYELRPLTVAELLDRCFLIYRQHFMLLVGIMAVPNVMLLALSLGSQVLTSPHTHLLSRAGADRALMTGAVAAGALIGFLLFVGYLVGYAFAAGATMLAVSDLYAGREFPTIQEAYRKVRGHVGAIIIVMLNVGARLLMAWVLAVGVTMAPTVLMPFLGTAGKVALGVFMVVLGITAIALCVILSLRYSLALPATVLEQVPPSEGVRRSVFLAKGSMLRIVLMLVVGTIVSYIAALVVQVPFTIGVVMTEPESTVGFTLLLLSSVFGTVARTIVAPLAVVGIVVVYLDARARKEAFDIRLLLDGLDGRGGSDALAGPPAFPAT